MRWLLLAVLCLPACTWTHRVVLTYEVPDAPAQNAAWQKQVVDRVNLIAGCLSEQQRHCLDQNETKGVP